jgi:hypothetical protein
MQFFSVAFYYNRKNYLSNKAFENVSYNDQEFLIVIVIINAFRSTVRPVYNGHPWDPKIEAVVDRWPLFRGVYYKN